MPETEAGQGADTRPAAAEKATRPARPARREPKVEVARKALSEKGSALHALCVEMLAGRAEVGVEVDEVSLRAKLEDVAGLCVRLRGEPELDFDYLRSISVVDYVDHLEVNHHLFSYRHRHKLVVKTDLSPEAPSLATVSGTWRAAEWFERECHDLFGVEFVGHPDPAPLLLYEGFEGHPGRKSYPLHDYDEW